MYDLYKSNKSDSERYILGKSGKNKIFVIGLNPSTANKEKSDTTIAKVEQVAINSGYMGFVMANLYPLRSTNPDDLPLKPTQDSITRNISEIIKYAKEEQNPIFWAAWGINISIRHYLFESLVGLNEEIKKINGAWQCYGNLTKIGHPKHPSRLSYDWDFQAFALDKYIEKIA